MSYVNLSTTFFLEAPPAPVTNPYRETEGEWTEVCRIAGYMKQGGGRERAAAGSTDNTVSSVVTIWRHPQITTQHRLRDREGTYYNITGITDNEDGTMLLTIQECVPTGENDA